MLPGLSRFGLPDYAVRDHLGLVDYSSTGMDLSTKGIILSYLDEEVFMLLEAVVFHKALDLTFDVMNVRKGVVDAAKMLDR